MSRFFLTLYIIALISAVISTNEANEEVVTRQAFVTKLVQGVVSSWFTGATVNCVNQAAQNCQSHWGEKTKMYDCTTSWFKANQGRCAFRI